MSRRFSILLVVLTIVSVLIGGVEMASAQSSEYAKDLHRHNLIDKAKETFIDILYNAKSTDADKTDALYWLGQISFEEGRYTVALGDWEKLVTKYPKSSQAIEVSNRLAQIREITSKISSANISSAVARYYIENGDFWVDGIEKFNKSTFITRLYPFYFEFV